MKRGDHSVNEGRRLFIAVMADEELSADILSFRSWMTARYGCRSGHRTPPHVTLVPPFVVGGQGRSGVAGAGRDSRDADAFVDDLEASLSDHAVMMKSFDAELDGFDAFGDRTLFAAVKPDDRWNRLHDGLYKRLGHDFPGMIPFDKKPFYPHMTVANRDIPAGEMTRALGHFREEGFTGRLIVNHFALLTFAGGEWRELGRCIFPE